MKLKPIFLFAALIILPIVLLGCGGGDDSEPADTTAGDAVSGASSGDSAGGEELFQLTCSPCHGPEGKGIEGLGKDFTTSEFVKGSSNSELLAFVKEGRPFDHPDNTTGVEMPPSGGNPNLTDGQLTDIIAFVRTLQQ
jgi:disulfide bond formation protein DsbB